LCILRSSSLDIISLLSRTYQAINKKLLQDTLHLTQDQLNTLITERGWKRTVDAVTFEENPCNQPHAKKLAQRVPFDSMGVLLQSMTV
jgi:CSN8/PSMD8/EIF3K family